MSLSGERWVYNFQLERITEAYRASRSAFEKQLDGLDRELSGRLKVDKEHEEEYRDHLIDLASEADHGIGLIREAFALTFYHFWERSVQDWLKKIRYDYWSDIPALVATGDYLADQLELDRMRMTANTIKHGAGKLYAAHPAMFNSQINDYIRDKIDPPYGRLLDLTNQDIEDFIGALKRSGPNAQPRIEF